MSVTLLSRFACPVALLCLAGCGTQTIVNKTDVDLFQRFETSRFFFAFEDGSDSAPDNLDGYINLIWTNDEDRDEFVSEQILRLVDELTDHGFAFVESKDESTVVAKLKLKSVRFDPVSGWITDDAKLTYMNTEDDVEVGNVVSNEVWVTPKLKMVIDSLVRGSLELWGRPPDK